MKITISCTNLSAAPNKNVAPKALQRGNKTDDVFFLYSLLKSTRPDDFLNDALVFCTLETDKN